MEFLGIGITELFFIILIALIILGPRDMVKAGRTIGRFLRRTIFSPSWLNIQSKVRTLPYTLMREAGLEELDLNQGIKDFKQEVNQVIGPDLQTTAGLNTLTQEIKESTQIPTEWVSTPSTPAAATPAPSTPDSHPAPTPSVIVPVQEDGSEPA